MVKAETRYLICVDNEGYPASLEARKVYVRLADAEAESRGLVRVIDETGEDYLYPEKHFAVIELPDSAQRAFAASA